MIRYRRSRILLPLLAVLLTSLACGVFSTTPTPTLEAVEVLPATATPTRTAAPPTRTPTALPSPTETVQPASDEPVFITGDIPYTWPFFTIFLTEPIVLLEDQAGFVNRDREFIFPLSGQVIGPIEVLEEDALRYSLALPSIPQATFVDVDNNGQEDTGVQVFAITFQSNTWGDTFLEERDAGGWSGTYASTSVDAERHGEVDGGILLVWSPDEQQGFPTGFGPDNMLFTEDDPTAPIPAGYTLVDLDSEPFTFWKEAQPEITLLEGELAVNDYTEMSYTDAFDALFEKVSREYPFTEDKQVDWQLLYDVFQPEVASAGNDNEFYIAMKSFSLAIPDRHIGISFNPDVFVALYGGSFGLRLAELTDGRVIVVDVIPDTAGEQAGIEVGAEIIEWENIPVRDVLEVIVPDFGPYSTPSHERLDKLLFLTRYPVGTEIVVTFQNPGAAARTVQMRADFEVETLFDSIPSLSIDEMDLPVEGDLLEEFGIGYISITSFSDDARLTAHVWERFMDILIDQEIPGLIIDVRINGGGLSSLSQGFVGYFFDEEIEIFRRSYFNDISGEFEYSPGITKIYPGPKLYEGQVIVLVSPDCVSACEGFAHMMQQNGRATIMGHYPTAGAFGEVGRGQYELPGEYSMQFPTGRPETLDGDLLIEGVGIIPDVIVPVTEDSARGLVDAVLERAIQELSGLP